MITNCVLVAMAATNTIMGHTNTLHLLTSSSLSIILHEIGQDCDRRNEFAIKRVC